MNELLLPQQFTFWECIKMIFALNIFPYLYPILIRLVRKKISPDRILLTEEFKKFYIVYVVIVLLFSVTIGSFFAKYLLDITFKQTVIVQEVLPEFTTNNTGNIFKIRKKRITVSGNNYHYRDLDNYFVGKYCEIEYYRFSKRVKRLTLLE